MKNTKTFTEITNVLYFIVTSSPDKSLIAPKKRHFFTLLRNAYWLTLFTFLVVSFLPLLFPNAKENTVVITVSIATGTLLFVDLIFRWILYPFAPDNKKRNKLILVLLFPLTLTGIILIFSVFPIIGGFINLSGDEEVKKVIIKISSFLLFFRVLRFVLLLNVFTIFSIIIRVFKKQGKMLANIFLFIIVFTVLIALVIFSVEKDKNPNIKSYFDALYFTGISLTTIGYGDIGPVTVVGKILVLIMAIIGIAIFAIPSGIIAGGFISELKKENDLKTKLKVKKIKPFQIKKQ